MRLGILADIHEDVPKLALALRHCRRQGADQVVLLGDVFDTGKHLRETVALLADAGAVGVWGNHDLGLCHEPGDRVRERYAGPALDFMRTLRPRLEVEGCLFTHGLPCWDAPDPLVYESPPLVVPTRTAHFGRGRLSWLSAPHSRARV